MSSSQKGVGLDDFWTPSSYFFPGPCEVKCSVPWSSKTVLILFETCLNWEGENRDWFLKILLNLLGWLWLIKLYRFQVYSSITHHLYIGLCVCHPNSSLLLSPFIPPLPSYTFPHPPFLLGITILLSLCMNFFSAYSLHIFQIGTDVWLYQDHFVVGVGYSILLSWGCGTFHYHLWQLGNCGETVRWDQNISIELDGIFQATHSKLLITQISLQAVETNSWQIVGHCWG